MHAGIKLGTTVLHRYHYGTTPMWIAIHMGVVPVW